MDETRPGIHDANDLIAVIVKLHLEGGNYRVSYTPDLRPVRPYIASVSVWRFDERGERIWKTFTSDGNTFDEALVNASDQAGVDEVPF